MKTFLQECKVELDKVQWPTREEVVNSTIVVLFTVIVFSLFLFFTDAIFLKALTWMWSFVG
ncbi:MAG: preprotein translocase subunit SecE [Leptospiraceae bacterium]|nr:preprotein translocase subunit SecE [Leptospiraceae bacterium]